MKKNNAQSRIISNTISRRGFLGAAGAASIALGGLLAGCSPQGGSGQAESKAVEQGDGASASPSFLTPPEPVSEQDISETLETEILIIGAGIAGIAAARAASEAGSKVLVVEKAATYGVRSSKYGPLNASVHKQLGQPEVNKTDVINALQRSMGYRADSQLLNYWADHSGEDFDWWCEPVDFYLRPDDSSPVPEGTELWLKPTHWPHDPSYDWQDEYAPCVIGEVAFGPDGHTPVCVANAEIAIENGAEFIFSTFAHYLTKDGDRVNGAVVQHQDGTYRKINASQGVILCCGDISNDPEMMQHYLPWATDYATRYTTYDCNNELANTGDGHKMGMWAGACMEDGPLAPMTHNVGIPTAVGVDPFLLLNMNGERFMNEDVSGQDIENALARQKGHTAFQILDSKWKEQLSAMPCGMANMTGVVPDDEYEGGGEKTSEASFLDSVTHTADTIDELIEMMGLPKDTAKASIDRYNELALKGIDEDYGKKPTRLFPIEEGPFYACQFSQALILVVMGGLVVDPHTCQALDKDHEPIDGLYVAGNTMGGRFLVDYPTVVQGISHSSCMTFGRLAGTTAASA